ncbi:MAG: aminotransferase class V-fold PLP-dependent enzyme [Thalassobaculum sp.]|uniref:aminotransferase class V-fold PLP-dependent enzyme n=1 Tax=Thalassobaculum sp. TaxID=2022740 RepID=UPI0032ECB018
MPIDLARARAETRACADLVHLNHAGASLMPAPVADALVDWLREEEMTGGYETARRHDGRLENFYDASAKLLNCHRDEIACVENATRAWDMAFYALDLRPGDRILTAECEYGSNMIAYLHRARRDGCEVAVVPSDQHGQLDVAALEAMIDARTRLISISHIPTGGGLVNPAEAVGAVARKYAIPYLLDACQSVGQMPVDVEKIGCDFLSATGRKYLRGPRGTGLLYVKHRWIAEMDIDPPLLDQHAATLVSETEYRMRGDARRFENWECYFAGKAALGTAIDYALGFGMDAIHQRVTLLADGLRARLAEIPGVTITDQGVDRCGIVTFTKAGEKPVEIRDRCIAKGINISASSGSGSRVGFDRRGLDAVVRASVHYVNDDQDIDRFVEEIRRGG